MVAYSFKPSFVPLIRAKVKRQTIRRERKRHARAGEQLQLFTGARFSPTRLGNADCLRAPEIRLDFLSDLVELDGFESISGFDALNAFALRDGFERDRHGCGMESWEYMGRWWSITHGVAVFSGRLIDWNDSFKGVP